MGPGRRRPERAAWRHSHLLDESVLKTTLPAKGKKPPQDAYITIQTQLYRRPVTKKEDKGLAQTMVPVESGLVRGGKESLAPETIPAFQALYAAIPASLKAKDPDYGKLTSGFRGMEEQEKLFEKAVQKNLPSKGGDRKAAEAAARKWNAAPGTSAHNTGHAVDLWDGLGHEQHQREVDAEQEQQELPPARRVLGVAEGERPELRLPALLEGALALEEGK